MTASSVPIVTAKDTAILRDLAKRIAEIAATPEMAARKQLITDLNGLRAEQPVIITETQGVLDEVIPLEMLSCEGEWARAMERGLRNKIFYFEQIGDDSIILPRVTYGHVVHDSGYGVHEIVHRGNDGAGHGSINWEPPLQSLPDDLQQLQYRTFEYDAEATLQGKMLLEEVFGGSWRWSTGVCSGGPRG